MSVLHIIGIFRNSRVLSISNHNHQGIELGILNPKPFRLPLPTPVPDIIIGQRWLIYPYASPDSFDQLVYINL